ncbi:MAG: HNH endonuclease [Chloroflexi bacterium]|nr:HNH endonuclease [Chloroflexota bacterium]
MSGRTGASNPNWKGGVSPERQRLYASAEWREVVRAVKRRDGGCVECGSAAELHVHHIESFAEFPSLRLHPLNLETLCRPCHYEKHRKGVKP